MLQGQSSESTKFHQLQPTTPIFPYYNCFKSKEARLELQALCLRNVRKSGTILSSILLLESVSHHIQASFGSSKINSRYFPFFWHIGTIKRKESLVESLSLCNNEGLGFRGIEESSMIKQCWLLVSYLLITIKVKLFHHAVLGVGGELF